MKKESGMFVAAVGGQRRLRGKRRNFAAQLGGHGKVHCVEGGVSLRGRTRAHNRRGDAGVRSRPSHLNGCRVPFPLRAECDKTPGGIMISGFGITGRIELVIEVAPIFRPAGA